MPLPVGVEDVEEGHLQAPQGRLELLQRGGPDHVPVLLHEIEAGPGPPGAGPRRGPASGRGRVRGLDRSSVRGTAAKRAVLLPHAQGVLTLVEGAYAAVPAVAALDQLQLVEVGAVHGVVGVGPAEVVVEGDAEQRKADQGGPVGVHAQAPAAAPRTRSSCRPRAGGGWPAAWHGRWPSGRAPRPRRWSRLPSSSSPPGAGRRRRRRGGSRAARGRRCPRPPPAAPAAGLRRSGPGGPVRSG